MSKKHFIALAAALRRLRPTADNHAAMYQWEADCMAVASACADFNPAFRRDQFLTACGVDQ